MLGNTELQEFSWQLRAAEAKVLQASLRPNPELSVEVEDVLGSGDFHVADEAQVTLQLARLVELGGKRSARLEVADRARGLSSRDFEAKRVEVLAETTRRFIRLLAAQSEMELAESALQLSASTLASVRRRVKAGADSPLSEQKALTALARLRIAHEHAEHGLKVARYGIASMWGSRGPEFAVASGDLYGTRALQSFDALVARLNTSPEIVRSTDEISLREAEIRLADTRKIPDIALSGGARWLEGPGEHSFVFGVSMPFPISDRNQGNRAEARALLEKSRQSAATIETRLRALLFGLYQELSHAAIALEMLERDVLPGAERSLELSRNSFAEGRFSYLELADAQRTLVDVRAERIETGAEYHEFVLEIERILGAPIDEPVPPVAHEAQDVR
jgi:cobalt-zinc-cadmium efflux system outer membrane protein